MDGLLIALPFDGQRHMGEGQEDIEETAFSVIEVLERAGVQVRKRIRKAFIDCGVEGRTFRLSAGEAPAHPLVAPVN
jgi:hypothetical protein